MHSGREKENASKASRAAHEGLHLSAADAAAAAASRPRSKTEQKKRKRAAEMADESGSLAAAAAASRALKRKKRPKKISAFDPESNVGGSSKKKKKKSIQGFETEIVKGQRRVDRVGGASSGPRNAPRPRSKAKKNVTVQKTEKNASYGNNKKSNKSFKSKMKHKRR